MSGSSTPFCQSRTCSRQTSGVPSRVSPPTTISPLSPRRLASSRTTSLAPATSTPSTDVTRAPVGMFAAAAMLAGAGVPKIGGMSRMPTMNTSQYANTASSRLAPGPAMAIAMRQPGDRRLKLRAASSGDRFASAGSPSRSSSMRT